MARTASVLLLLILTTQTLLANPLNYFSTHHPIVMVQGGGFDVSQGRAQHIGIVDAIGDEFTLDQRHDRNILLGLGLFYDGFNTPWFDTLFGVNAFYFAPTSVNGNVVQENLFANLSYHYSVYNFPIYAVLRGLISNCLNEKYNVTFDLGIGPNFIRTNNFGEGSLDGGVTIPDRAFSGKTTTALSGMIGVGLKFNNLFNQTPLECGYRFFYLGKGKFNKLTNQLTSSLDTGHPYANAIICSVSV